MPIVNEVLRPFGHTLHNETAKRDGGTMVFNVLSGVWNGIRAWLTGSEGPLVAERQRQEDFLRERRQRERLDERDEHNQKDAEGVVETLLISDALRHANEELSRDIGDALNAVRLAYEKAIEDQERARLALEEVQRNAIVLPDGRRVYFARDGKLYGEDRREITDADALAEAQRQREAKPGVSGFEIYEEKRGHYDNTTARVQLLEQALNELDDLRELQRTGEITPEEVQRRRDELDRIIHSLPPDVREDYERMRAARQEGHAPAYREAPVLETAPNVNADFARAEDAFAKQTAEAQPDGVSRQPVTRIIPDF